MARCNIIVQLLLIIKWVLSWSIPVVGGRGLGGPGGVGSGVIGCGVVGRGPPQESRGCGGVFLGGCGIGRSWGGCSGRGGEGGVGGYPFLVLGEEGEGEGWRQWWQLLSLGACPAVYPWPE